MTRNVSALVSVLTRVTCHALPFSSFLFQMMMRERRVYSELICAGGTQCDICNKALCLYCVLCPCQIYRKRYKVWPVTGSAGVSLYYGTFHGLSGVQSAVSSPSISMQRNSLGKYWLKNSSLDFYWLNKEDFIFYISHIVLIQFIFQ